MRLELRHVEDGVDARHPRRETVQQIRIGAPASTNAEGTQPSGRKLALAVQQREVSGVQHDLLANVELQMPMALIILLFLRKLRLCNMFLCFTYKILNFGCKV